jgi:hypothetical protein
VYVCVSNNTSGSVRVEVRLQVDSADLRVRVTPPEQTVDANRPALFECAVKGHPVDEVAWYKNARRLEMGYR